VPARRVPSWAWVTGLTVGAVAVVAFLTVKADQGPHPTATTASRPSASATPGTKPSPAPEKTESTVVPDDSGTGRRIVYSVGEKRVWLVDASDTPRRTFAVWPGTVSPDPGTYTVSTRTRGAITGSDGVRIEHIVYFAAKSGVNVAFSNAVDGSSPPPAASGTQTGGVRMRTADGAALWTFGEAGTTVVVVS
jgi:hypothetical protein